MNLLAESVFEKSGAKYSHRIMIVDKDNLVGRSGLQDVFSSRGFEIVVYRDDLDYRINHGNDENVSEKSVLLIVNGVPFIPYDVYKDFREYQLTWEELFPRLHGDTLRQHPEVDIELLYIATQGNYDDLRTRAGTEQFLQKSVYQKDTVTRYLEAEDMSLSESAKKASHYRDWIQIAKRKSILDVLAVRYKVDRKANEINSLFKAFLLKEYGKLAGEIDRDTPILVSRAMEFMMDASDKFAIIVMDGMSEFDWRILSEGFKDIKYAEDAVFAMIPTVTSVSRQCLLSGKFPKELENAWSQSKEKVEFIACAKKLGFQDNQISYQRGYDADFGGLIRCGAVILNDVDDMVHGQKQGREGMAAGITLLSESGQLVSLTQRLLSAGFDVFISADHGNVMRTGMGRYQKAGVETETRSHCMMVLKDFADKEPIRDQYHLIEFPKYYLPDEYDYLICDTGDSFDIKGDVVMTHGGITIEEVIVPFIMIKADENNG